MQSVLTTGYMTFYLIHVYQEINKMKKLTQLKSMLACHDKDYKTKAIEGKPQCKAYQLLELE